MAATVGELTALGKALSHPLRVELIRGLRSSEPQSPNSWSKPRGLPLGNVAHHVKVLFKLGVFDLARTEPVRGASEHFYTLSGPLAPLILVALDAIDTEVVNGSDTPARSEPVAA